MSAAYIETNKGWISSAYIVRIAELKDGEYRVYFMAGGDAPNNATATEDAVHAYWSWLKGD